MEEKLVLFCKKAKPYLKKSYGFDEVNYTYELSNNTTCPYTLSGTTKPLNGMVVLECDYQIEKIEGYGYGDYYATKSAWHNIEFGLGNMNVDDCLKGKSGYAIHIKNLKIFNEPRRLGGYNKIINTTYGEEPDAELDKSPKKMIDCCRLENNGWKRKKMLSVTSEEMYEILKGEQTIIIRRSV